MQHKTLFHGADKPFNGFRAAPAALHAPKNLQQLPRRMAAVLLQELADHHDSIFFAFGCFNLSALPFVNREAAEEIQSQCGDIDTLHHSGKNEAKRVSFSLSLCREIN